MPYYKYCIVPLCPNTTFTTPNKNFIFVPKHPAIRQKWCKVINRDEKKNKTLSDKTTRCVCEDHFNLEEDLENYMRWKTMGGKMFLKKDVVPHIFECQNRSGRNSRTTGEKRKRLKIIEEAMKKQPMESLAEEALQPSTSNCSPSPIPIEKNLLPISKAVQVNITKNVRSRSTNTCPPVVSSVACSPFKDSSVINKRFTANNDTMHPVLPKGAMKDKKSETASECSSDKENCIDLDYTNDGSEADEEFQLIENLNSKKHIREVMISLIEKNSHLYLGVPQQFYFIINLLSESIHMPVLHILITLNKIRLNLSYELLGNQFGVSASSVCRIFRKTLPAISCMLRKFIVWPSTESVQANLPTPFRARYEDVESIIDCFEIEIQKPGNSVHQSLTWSDYKSCNTLKYLVSCTPDGQINFVSCGYCGRATDSAIAEDSGYLDFIRPGMTVMADRGFKNIAHLLEDKGAKLIRPSSVHKDTILTNHQVRESKKIAALRIHVERVIRRIREFNILKMHAQIDQQLYTAVDHMVYVVCGLINIQNRLIK